MSHTYTLHMKIILFFSFLCFTLFETRHIQYFYINFKLWTKIQFFLSNIHTAAYTKVQFILFSFILSFHLSYIYLSHYQGAERKTKKNRTKTKILPNENTLEYFIVRARVFQRYITAHLFTPKCLSEQTSLYVRNILACLVISKNETKAILSLSFTITRFVVAN